MIFYKLHEVEKSITIAVNIVNIDNSTLVILHPLGRERRLGLKRISIVYQASIDFLCELGEILSPHEDAQEKYHQFRPDSADHAVLLLSLESPKCSHTFSCSSIPSWTDSNPEDSGLYLSFPESLVLKKGTSIGIHLVPCLRSLPPTT